MSERNSLDLESDLTAIVAMRILKAPRQLVWNVWSDPEHLARWWGPNGFSITTHSFDMRPGGVWRFVMHGPDGRDYQNRITYEEVVAPERIVTRHGGGEDVEPVEFRTIITLDDLGSRTRLTFKMLFASAEIRQRIIETYGADKGLVQTLARLDAHLEEIGGGNPMQTFMPFLWFDNNAEEAIDFYASLFTDAKVISKRRNKDGTLFTATLELGGVRYGLLNGGPHYKLTPAFSIMVNCDGQAEVDRLWAALTANGGEESRCGWLRDRFGLSWQIIPKRMSELMESENKEAANRVTQAMLKMRKIDLATLERAYANAA